MFRRIQHVHLVGIGGIGMSGIGEVLLNMGFRVSGSDLRRSEVTNRLEGLGASIFEGHAAENLTGAPHVVVRSTAVRDDNPEVVEADESDRSFLMLTPTFAVVTNIDREHMDYYADMMDVRKCFTDFVNKVPFYGASVLCLDDPHVQAVIPEVVRRRITYGLSAQADISAREVRYNQQFGSTFQARQFCETPGEVALNVPGLHNVYNALAATAIGLELEVPFDVIAGALADFRGVNRRFQFKGEEAGVIVVDDYGHHPAEIRATPVAAKLGTTGRRMVVLFQPHRYTRTQDLMDEFARSFNNADVLMVTDVYAASEQPIEGVSGEALVEAVSRFGHKDARYVGSVEDATQALLEEAHENDMVITLGAGNVYRAGETLVELLRGREGKSGEA